MIVSTVARSALAAAIAVALLTGCGEEGGSDELQVGPSPELPERLLPLVLAAAVLTDGLPAGAGEAARQWLRTVPEDRGELAWDPPIDLHGLALGRTEALTEFAARVRTEAGR